MALTASDLMNCRYSAHGSIHGLIQASHVLSQCGERRRILNRLHITYINKTLILSRLYAFIGRLRININIFYTSSSPSSELIFPLLDEGLPKPSPSLSLAMQQSICYGKQIDCITSSLVDTKNGLDKHLAIKCKTVSYRLTFL